MMECFYCEMPKLPFRKEESGKSVKYESVLRRFRFDQQAEEVAWKAIEVSEGGLRLVVLGLGNWLLEQGFDGVIPPGRRWFLRGGSPGADHFK